MTESKFPYQIRMVGYKKSSSAIYAHFKEKRISQSMDIPVRDGEPKSRPPGSKSTTSFSRNTDLSKSKSTNRCVTFTGILRRGIARRRASEQSWLKISQKVPTTLEHQGLQNSQNGSCIYTGASLLPDIGWSQRVRLRAYSVPRTAI